MVKDTLQQLRKSRNRNSDTYRQAHVCSCPKSGPVILALLYDLIVFYILSSMNYWAFQITVRDVFQHIDSLVATSVFLNSFFFQLLDFV